MVLVYFFFWPFMNTLLSDLSSNISLATVQVMSQSQCRLVSQDSAQTVLCSQVHFLSLSLINSKGQTLRSIFKIMTFIKNLMKFYFFSMDQN